MVPVRSAVKDILPQPVRRSLAKFGADIRIARQKRRLTVAMMAERVGVAKPTYLRVEKGDPSVTFGIYAMTLFVLGFGAPFGEIVDQTRDSVGLSLDEQRLPKLVRPKRERRT
jgi:transcriptional regulator with XRE-family HTH domain